MNDLEYSSVKDKYIEVLEKYGLAKIEAGELFSYFDPKDFFNDIFNILPTCTTNERKFLDELKVNFVADCGGDLKSLKYPTSHPLLEQYQFEAKLPDLVEKNDSKII